ncbi:hypothetical protein BC829DRAFT_448117 [Chytridium lagenaria]|nr:hypothetical protein BC829DRAFT_448117 [Chytridium lagenaria]
MPSITNILALLFAVLVTLTQAIPSATFSLHTPAISPPFKPREKAVDREMRVTLLPSRSLWGGFTVWNRRGGIFGVSAARTSSIVAVARTAALASPKTTASVKTAAPAKF